MSILEELEEYLKYIKVEDPAPVLSEYNNLNIQ
jgi:hypothetical protein